MLIASLSVPILRTLQVRLMALEQRSDGPFPPTIDLARTNERDAAMSFPPPPPPVRCSSEWPESSLSHASLVGNFW